MCTCIETQSVLPCSDLRYHNIYNLPKCVLGQLTGQKLISFNKAEEIIGERNT